MIRPTPTLTAWSYFYLMTQPLSSCDSINVMTSLKLASQSHFCLGVLLFTLRGSGTLCLGLERRDFLMALSKPELPQLPWVD